MNARPRVGVQPRRRWVKAAHYTHRAGLAVMARGQSSMGRQWHGGKNLLTMHTARAAMATP
ncbi:hypothetical protein EMIT047CA2_230017 [Pseudomonas soli]